MAKTPVPLKPGPMEVLDAIKSIVNAAADYGKVKQQEMTKREEIRANRDVLLSRIEAARETVMMALDQDFQLRNKALDKQLDLIERALDDNNLEALNMSLQSLVMNIQASPLKSFNNFKLALENDQIIEI